MSVTSPAPAPPLAADDLHVRLGGTAVLSGVSLTVAEGESVALLGGNGSGKSTLLRSCLGLVPVTSGEVALFGDPLVRFRRWHCLGYVPQHSTGTLRGATVAEVVGSGRLSVRTPFLPGGRVHRAAVDHALHQVGLLNRRGDEINTLSGGQQQRALIARALVNDPELLVLDEPTAGVDLDHQDELAQILGALLDEGRSMLVVLHEIGPMAPLIQRTVRLRDGRVVTDAVDEPDPSCHEAPPVGQVDAFGLSTDILTPRPAEGGHA